MENFTCPICGYNEKLSARSIRQLHLYWKMLDLVFENQVVDVFPDTNALHDTIKTYLGYVKPRYDIRGNLVDWIPVSVAIHKMSPQDFNKFMDRAVTLVVNNLMPNMESEEVRNELNNLLRIHG